MCHKRTVQLPDDLHFIFYFRFELISFYPRALCLLDLSFLQTRLLLILLALGQKQPLTTYHTFCRALFSQLE